MKFTQFALGLSLFSAAALAETFTGSLTDAMCKDKDQTTHTTKCMLSCAKSGYGLVTADGKFLKFDEGGNAKALKALKATKKEQNVRAKVTGTAAGETIKVDKIEIE